MNTIIFKDNDFDFWPYAYHIKQAIDQFLEANPGYLDDYVNDNCVTVSIGKFDNQLEIVVFAAAITPVKHVVELSGSAMEDKEWFLDDNEIDAVVRDLDSCYQDSRVQVFADASEMIQQFRRKNTILEEALRMAELLYASPQEWHKLEYDDLLKQAEAKLYPDNKA